MNEDVEIIRRLVADHDPAAGLIAATAHADPHGRAALERILAVPVPRTHRFARWPFPVLPSLVWVAIAATFVFLVVRKVDAGSQALAATPAPLAYHLPAKAPSGRGLLLQLAAVAKRQSAPVTHPGRPYAYVKDAGWYLVTNVSGEQVNSKVAASTTESWTAPNAFNRSVTTRLPGNGSRVSATALGRVTGGSAGPGPPLLRLSNVPAVVAHQLDIGHPRSIGPVERFVSLTDLALNQPIPPGAESAILRVLARSPGLIDSGDVTDRAGRPGVAVSLDSAYSGLPTRYTLIFDPHTGSLLDEEETLLGNPGKLNVRPRSVIAYTVFLASGYVARPFARP
jgi:hypothetical protein